MVLVRAVEPQTQLDVLVRQEPQAEGDPTRAPAVVGLARTTRPVGCGGRSEDVPRGQTHPPPRVERVHQKPEFQAEGITAAIFF